MRSRSGIESAFISRSWRSLVLPRMGRQFILPRQESFASLHILTRRASEGSEALPSLARRVRMSFFGARVIAWRRQPQGIPNEPIILSPRGGGRGNSRQGRHWCRVARADRDSQVSALGVGLRSGAPFRCTHRIAHRKRGPLSTRTLRCTLPFQLSIALVALLALVALFLPTATLASRNNARRLCA